MPVPPLTTHKTSDRGNEAVSAGRSGPFYVRVGEDLAGPVAGGTERDRADLLAHDNEPFWASEEHYQAFHDAGLGCFDAIMQSEQGFCMRALKKRENWQLPVTVRGRPRYVFLKKHRTRLRWRRLKAWLGLPARPSAGRIEAENIFRLETAGIPSLELAGYGERLRHDGVLESFLVTPELEGFTQLDDFLRTRFAAVHSEHSDRRDLDLRRLTSQVAEIARRFHEVGFNHRDFYCCHFFVRESSPGAFEIRLIDLQRVQHRKQRRRRWLVKDLAQLAYSAPRDRIKCTERMAFVRRYFGVRKLRPEHKRLVREILAKQHAMERKLGLIA